MKVLFTGTFNPFTVGHLSVYNQACGVFGKANVFIGIAQNPTKHSIDPKHLKWTINAVSNNTVIIPTTSLISDFCKQNNFDLVVRSMRNLIDVSYEMDMAHWNSTMDIQTVFLPCEEGMEKMSSSALRELHSFGKDVSKHMPPFVYERWTNNPKQIIVTGKIGSGKSSFIEAIFNKELGMSDYVRDMDEVARRILPKDLMEKIGNRVKKGEDFIEKDMDKAGRIFYTYLAHKYPLIRIFEVSVLGTYTQFNNNDLNKLYQDSVVVKVDRFEDGRQRHIDPDFFKKALSLQKDPKIYDYVIDDRVQSREDIKRIALKALHDIRFT